MRLLGLMYNCKKMSGLANGATPKFGGNGGVIPGRAHRDGSSPGSMPVLAGPAGNSKGELHRIAGNTIHPRRVNGECDLHHINFVQ